MYIVPWLPVTNLCYNRTFHRWYCFRLDFLVGGYFVFRWIPNYCNRCHRRIYRKIYLEVKKRPRYIIDEYLRKESKEAEEAAERENDGNI